MKIKTVSFRYSSGKFILQKINTFLQSLLYNRSSVFLNAGYPKLIVFSHDVVGGGINIEGRYENDELLLIKEFLEKNELITGCALDVGANIGNHSIYFSNYYDRIFSFEPNPVTFKLLDLNCGLFAKNITTYQFGIADCDGSLPFYIPNLSNYGGSKLVEIGVDIVNSTCIEVDVKTLDKINDLSNQKIGLLKIDVEGYELQVIKGGKNLIRKNRPVILFEQHRNDFKNGRSPVIDYLNDFGYEFYISTYFPKRSAKLGFIRRVFNILYGSIMGSKYSIIKCDKFEHDDYSLIIAIHSNIDK